MCIYPGTRNPLKFKKISHKPLIKFLNGQGGICTRAAGGTQRSGNTAYASDAHVKQVSRCNWGQRCLASDA
jgi:hypothetical protein